MPADTKPKNAERLPEGPSDPTLRAARKATRRPDDGEAFLPDPLAEGRHAPLTEDEAEAFGEEYIASATAGEPVNMEANDEVGDDEDGGPFLILDTEEDVPEAEGEEFERRPGPGNAMGRTPPRRSLP